MDLLNLTSGTLRRKLNLEFQKNNFYFLVDNDLSGPSSWEKWIGALTVGCAYKNGNNSTYGLMADVNVEDPTTSSYHLGFKTRIKDLTLKGKIDN